MMKTETFLLEGEGEVEFMVLENPAAPAFVAIGLGDWSIGQSPAECEARLPKGAVKGLRASGRIVRLPEGCTHFTILDGSLRWRGAAPGARGQRLAFTGKGWE